MIHNIHDSIILNDSNNCAVKLIYKMKASQKGNELSVFLLIKYHHSKLTIIIHKAPKNLLLFCINLTGNSYFFFHHNQIYHQ